MNCLLFPPLNLNLWLWVTSTSKRLQTTARTGVLYWTTTHKPPASFMLQQGNTKHGRGSHRPPRLHHVTSPRPKLACAVVGASVNEKSKVLTYKALKLDFFYLKYSRKSGDKNIIISLIITVNIWRNWKDEKLFQQLRLSKDLGVLDCLKQTSSIFLLFRRIGTKWALLFEWGNISIQVHEDICYLNLLDSKISYYFFSNITFRRPCNSLFLLSEQ